MSTATLEAGRAGSRSRATSVRSPQKGRRPPPLTKLQAVRGLRLPPKAMVIVALLCASLVLAAGLATGGRGRSTLLATSRILDAVRAVAGQAPALFQGRLPDFGGQVAEVKLSGATAAARPEILAAAEIKAGQSLSGLDLAAVRTRVEQVGWVEHARVLRLWPDAVRIDVVQRPLMAVWQFAGKEVVVASNGAPVTEVDPSRFGGLPLIVGGGANLAAPALIAALGQRPAILAHVAALVRVDDRRWTLDLKDGGEVLLPGDDAEAEGLDRLARLQARANILGLGLARIDLRDPEMVLVRPRAAPPTAQTKTKGGV